MVNAKMVNILVVSDPPAAPGYLPRVRYLCEYLTRQGYAVQLLTEEYEALDFAHTYPIETIRMYSGSTLDWILKTVWTLITDWHNRAFARKAIYNLQFTNHKYDYVVCSAFSDFPLGAAQRIAKALNVPLICDIRDLDEQVNDSRYQYHHQTWWTMPFRRLYRAIHIRRRNCVLRAADAITTVSPWHAEFIKAISPLQSAVSVIYNGFDEKQFYPEDVQTDTFTVSYIGSFFAWQEEGMNKVKQAIKELGLPIRLEMHTPQKDTIAHDQLGDAIRRSAVMLVLTSPSTHGMLTTKFYEALGCEKPILCVPSDKGSLAELIDYTHAGVATDDVEEIKAFLQEKYSEWQAQGFTRQATEHRLDFTREAQCARLEQILNHKFEITNHKF